MTDYGRGSGAEAWDPQDPLYGERGWGAQQAGGDQAPPGAADPHGYAQQQPQGEYGAGSDPYRQQYPPQGYQGNGYEGQQQGYAEPSYTGGQYPVQQGYEAGQYPQQQDHAADPYRNQSYDQGYGGRPQQYAPQVQDPYGNQGGAHDPYQGQTQGQGHEAYQGQGHQVPYPGPSVPQQGGGWDTGGHPVAQPYQEAAGYGQQGQDPYAGGGQGQERPGRGEVPRQEGRAAGRAPEAPARSSQGRAPAEETEWDAEPEEETHPFFTGEEDGASRPRERQRRDTAGRERDREAASDDTDTDTDIDIDTDDDFEDGRRAPAKKKKGRNGVACLVVAVVLVGGVGGLAYVGYGLYQDHFGPPPDFAGAGAGVVDVEIPEGANGSQIAQLLVKNGVVKSAGAFVVAQNHNPRGTTIQAGAYTLKKGMSGSSAVALLLDPASRTALIIPEGTRDATVYKMIDKQLDLKAGTTADVAKAQAEKLGMPAWADDAQHIKDPLEGFLFPASYPVPKGAKPEDVLRRMVARANAEYTKYGLEAKAKSVGLDSPWQLLTVASLVQAEGKTPDDFSKMAEVVYNRLKITNQQTQQRLEFDSTYNYAKNQSDIDLTASEVHNNFDPYNTYTHRGLPPGPIGNPGEQAITAALDPTHDGWMYFVATDGNEKTEFARTYTQFTQLRDKFNDHQKGQG